MNWLNLTFIMAALIGFVVSVSAQTRGPHGGQVYEFLSGNKLEITRGQVYFVSGDKNFPLTKGEAKWVTPGENNLEFSMLINDKKFVVLSNGEAFWPSETRTILETTSPNQHMVRFRQESEYPALLVTRRPELKAHSVSLVMGPGYVRAIDQGELQIIFTDRTKALFSPESAEAYTDSQLAKSATIPDPKEVVDPNARLAIGVKIDGESFLVNELGGRTRLYFDLLTATDLKVYPFRLKDFTRGYFVSVKVESQYSKSYTMTLAVKEYSGDFINISARETPIRNLAAMGQSEEVLAILAKGFTKFRPDGYEVPPAIEHFVPPTLPGLELPSVRYRNRNFERDNPGVEHWELMPEVLYFLNSHNMTEEMLKLEALEDYHYRELVLIHLHDIISNRFHTLDSRKAAIRVVINGEFGYHLTPNRRSCLWLLGEKWKDGF